MLVSLVNQARKVHGRAYLALCLGLVLYLGIVTAVSKIAAGSEAAVEWYTRIDRVLYWIADTTASPVYVWLNLMGFGAVLPIAFSIAGIIHARDWIYSKQGENQLALLLSYPTSRPQMLGGIIFIQIVFVLGLALLSALVLFAGSLASGLNVGLNRLPAMAVLLTFLCLFFCFVTILAGNLSGDPGLAVGIGIAALLFSVVIHLLPAFTGLPPWLRWLSPLAVYLEGNPLSNGLQAVNWLGTVGWTLAAGAAAWLHFARLDLGN